LELRDADHQHRAIQLAANAAVNRIKVAAKTAANVSLSV
jgi:hypothetical protein